MDLRVEKVLPATDEEATQSFEHRGKLEDTLWHFKSLSGLGFRRSQHPKEGGAKGSGGALLLPDADRQDDDLDPKELEAALDRERGLVVERAREERLALEDQLAREHQ